LSPTSYLSSHSNLDLPSSLFSPYFKSCLQNCLLRVHYGHNRYVQFVLIEWKLDFRSHRIPLRLTTNKIPWRFASIFPCSIHLNIWEGIQFVPWILYREKKHF
jgi:hypothetical protein